MSVRECVWITLLLVTATQTFGQRPTTIDAAIRQQRRFHDRPTPGPNMVDAVLSTMESKLRRVENLDRAVQLMIQKLDRMENAVQENHKATTTRILNAESQEQQRHQQIMERLNYLTKKFDSVCEEDIEEIEDIIGLPSVIRNSKVVKPNGDPIFTSKRLSEFQASKEDTVELKEVMDDMKETVAGMDRRLAFHINIMAENIGEMSSMVKDVHQTILGTEFGTKINDTLQLTKLDLILQTLLPLNEMDEKLEKFDARMSETKALLKDWLPISEQLLEQSEREDKAISAMKTELAEKTSTILKRLTQVKEEVNLIDSEPDNDLHTSPSYARFLSARGKEVNQEPAADVASARSGRAELIYGNINEIDNEGPSVIFPSIENKPIFLNDSYEDGQNANGVSGYSCAELFSKGLRDSGIYYLRIKDMRFWFHKVFCDMETDGGGWTVIQRRGDFGEPRQNFNKPWEDYKVGFGQLKQEFWLGNENIHKITNSEEHELRIELQDFEGNSRYALYKSFRLGSEKDDYRIEISDFEGDAGDSLNDPWYGSNLRPFSTYDRDNDRSSLNCASMLKGGWWWKSCGRGLNGVYLNDPQDVAARQGIVWFRWRGWDYSLKASKMMIRPRNFSQSMGGDT